MVELIRSNPDWQIQFRISVLNRSAPQVFSGDFGDLNPESRPMASPADKAFPQSVFAPQRPPPAPDISPVVSQGTEKAANGSPHMLKPTFASILTKPKVTPRFPEIQLASRQYGTKDGVPSISFSPAEYQAATQRLAHTLIAKFQIGRPPFEVVKKTMLSAWKIEGRVTIASNWDDRHVIIILDSEKDVNEILTNPLRRVRHTMFRLFRWSADYNPKKESPTVTKWIRFPDMPMEMFDRAILRSIVSSFAVFLDCDDRTKEMDSLNFARTCVELDVTKAIPSSVWINLPNDKGFFQEIVVEGGLKYCSKCKIHGHEIATCRKTNKGGETVNNKDLDKKIREAKEQRIDAGIHTISMPKNNVQEWQVVGKRRNEKKSNNVVTDPNSLMADQENEVVEGAESTNKSVNQKSPKNHFFTSIKGMDKFKYKGVRINKRKSVRFGIPEDEIISLNSPVKEIANSFEELEIMEGNKSFSNCPKASDVPKTERNLIVENLVTGAENITSEENEDENCLNCIHAKDDSISHVSDSVTQSVESGQDEVNNDQPFFSEELGVIVFPKALDNFNRITKGVFKETLEKERAQGSKYCPPNTSQ
ncbi:unnamed protein product [Rhodiola kirilowii]